MEAVPTGGVIVRFTRGSSPSISTAARTRALDAVGDRHEIDLSARRTLSTGAVLVAGASPRQAAEIARDLNRRSDVAYAEPDLRLTASARATDPYYPRQWNLWARVNGVGADIAWSRSRGAGATVAVVDSGIIAHPDLEGRTVPGYDFISDAATSRDGDGRDDDPADAGDWQGAGECAGDEGASRSSWHGTHVAGIIAATGDNGMGISGVAPRARIQPVRVIGRCGGTLSDIADGLTWASGGAVAGVPANRTPTRIVNVSVGGEAMCPATLQAAINGARARNALIITAAGNSGGDAALQTPGNCRGVLNVGATSLRGARAGYSARGSAVHVSAPGGSNLSDAIWSTVDTGRARPTGPGYAPMIGTSMAAPHVSGVAALVLGTSPGMSAQQLRQRLVLSATPFRTSCRGCGSGIIDGARALNLLPAVGRSGR